MSVRTNLHAALAATLAANDVIAGAVTGIFVARPPRLRVPAIILDEPQMVDWSVKGAAGREARIAALVEDAGEIPGRLRMLMDAIEACLSEEMPADLGGGWRIVSMIGLQSRVARSGDARWTGLVAMRARMLRLQ